MTEELAKAALARVAEKLGGGWRAVERPARGAPSARKRFRLEYGGGEYAEYTIACCHGDTCRQALDSYVAACRLPFWGARVPEEAKAGSAEELILKLAVSGEIPESPRA